MAQNIITNFKNIDVLLAGPIGPDLKLLLDKRIKIFNHEYNSDEIHLILEYGINEVFEDTKAPAANRLVF
jgi:hypothetical protein